MLPNLCKIYQTSTTPSSPYLTITDRTVITGNIEKANFASLIYFEEKYHGSEKPFYLTVAEVDIYIAPLDVKQNSLAVPLGIPSAAPLEAPPAPPLDSNPPSASEKQSTTTSLPSEDPNTIIAAWAEPCEPKTEARKERYPSEECYWDNLAGLITAARKAMVWTPRRNRLEDGDWMVGYMHRNIIQKEKEKGEDGAHEDEVVESLKININAGTDGINLHPSQALQAAPQTCA
ncbi:hypothetical protein BZA77DRAFT_363013 [Pyronema omphalodes]|nr:hypothetical protein BZA77DRAFT_363013 [Pyronema omphalodes]